MNNEKKIWTYFLGKLHNSFGVAGLMGNLYAESNLRSNDLEGKYSRLFNMTDDEYTEAVDNDTYSNFVSDAAGYGLAQWTYWTRKRELLIYAKSRNVSIGDLDMQLDFLWNELQHYKTVLTALYEATDVRIASDAVMLNYERPANQSEDNQEKRAMFGQKYYDLYAQEANEPVNDNIQNLINLALNEVGYLEKKNSKDLDDKTANAGTENYTKYARDVDAISGYFNGKKQNAAWCAVFVNWLFIQIFGAELAKKMLYQPNNDNCAAGCGSARSYFNKAGALYQNPEVGDQIFFWSSDMTKVSHTGFVIKVDDERVYTVEGNTSDGTSVIANGGAVCQKSYPLNYKRIAGFGRPNWTISNNTSTDKSSEKGEDSMVELVEYNAKVVAPSGKTVNLRKTKSTNATVVAQVSIGETVIVVTHEDETWARVSYVQADGTGINGYMMRKFLEKIPDETNINEDLINKLNHIKTSLSQILVEIDSILGEAVG